MSTSDNRNEPQVQPARDATPAPLAGLRVIEVSSFVAAPLGGMTLAQLGAEVIRVDPLGGAADRHRWPITGSGVSLYWAGLNKGKRSVALNLRSERGRGLVQRLVWSCPPRTAVVLTNAVGQDWLSYEALRAGCSDLIHVQVQGRGNGEPAVDYTVNAEMGFPMITGPTGHGQPVNHVLPAWDIACGLYAATGVSAAARQRETSGQGDSISVALADVALAMAGNLGLLAEAQVNDVQRERIGNYLYGGFARDFESSDGRRFMVVALTARHWRHLLEVTDLSSTVEALEEALGADFTREDDRFEHREVLAALVARWFARHTAREAEAVLEDTALLWARYRTFAEAAAHLASPQGANPIVSVLEQPGVDPHLAPGSPLVSRGRPFVAEPAPELGGQTESMLVERLGLTSSELTSLRESGVIAGSWSPEEAR